MVNEFLLTTPLTFDSHFYRYVDGTFLLLISHLQDQINPKVYEQSTWE